jgi:hypothetical protein
MYLGCADSDVTPSNSSKYCCPIDYVDAPVPTSRVLKPIAGPALCKTVLPGSITGKPLDVSNTSPSYHPLLLAQILPPPQISPVKHSGEYFQIYK